MRQYVGKTIDGRFEVLQVIGQGGMGVVFEARQIALTRKCALKLLLPSAIDIPTVKQRFAREARLAAQVKHPNVVGILDTGTTSEGLPYIAMDYLDGESLDRTLARERVLPWARARHIVLQICSALAEAHSMGIVHRDLKPGNCMRITHAGDPDFIKLVDFGIAKALWGDDKQTKLTQRDVPIGTVDYMAYEQAYGLDDCDHRVDIWSAGVILYELVSGYVPFRGGQAAPIVQRLAAILSREPTPLASYIPDGIVPPGTDEIILRALAKDRSLRYQSIREFRDALAALPEVVPGAVATPVPAPHQESAGPTEINPNDVIDLVSASNVADPGVTPRTLLPDVQPADPTLGVVLPPLVATADAQPTPRSSLRALVGTSLLLVAGLVLILYTLMSPLDLQPERTVVANPTPEPQPPTPEPNPPTRVDQPPTRVDPPPTEVAPVPTTPPVGGDAPRDPPPEAKTRTSKRDACAALRSQLKQPISACIGTRSIPYGLSIGADTRGVLTSMAIDNPLLEDDDAYLCLRRDLLKRQLKNVVGPVSFACTVKR